jgi:hypothetical protein
MLKSAAPTKSCSLVQSGSVGDEAIANSGGAVRLSQKIASLLSDVGGLGPLSGREREAGRDALIKVEDCRDEVKKKERKYLTTTSFEVAETPSSTD